MSRKFATQEEMLQEQLAELLKLLELKDKRIVELESLLRILKEKQEGE